MYNITKCVFLIIISLYMYKYFKNIRNPIIINEYKQKLDINNDEDEYENIKKLSKRLDVLFAVLVIIAFTLMVFFNSAIIIIIMILSEIVLTLILLNNFI